MTAVRFSVLGPLTVLRDGRGVTVPGGKIRTLLAALLLRPNHVVSLHHLAERLWGVQPPRNPRRVLQTNAVRLRQALALSEVILTEHGGYSARLRPEQLDLLEFHQLIRTADRADTPEQESRLLHEALALWRGPVCSDVESDALHQIDVPPLAEQRLHALERRIDLDLRLGRDAELVAELRTLTAEHPLRERFWAHLMTALYRTGRQAEALDAFRTVSRTLKEELGIDPDVELRRLHQSILLQRHQPLEYALAQGRVTHLSRPVNGHANGTTTMAPRRTRSTPRQLPADVSAFVGREQELTILDHAGTVMITAIDGMAGVGKTALAIHAAHRLAPRFPDGDLFVDLHGYTQGMAPVEPADALARMLGALGVPGESIPQHVDDRAALYRSVLAGRKMLVVLDNAADEAQVRPLLPGAGGCRVLVTSRRRLVGLDDTRTFSVDVLPSADAIALFTGTAGPERVARAPVAVLAEVVRQCGLLPLAIRLAAARLTAHPSWSAADLLERLKQHRRRLSELRAGRRSVTAAIDLSYRELTTAEARAYRLLGLHPGTDIALAAAAAMLAAPVPRASALLDRLLEVHLLQEPVPGRYRFHDLVRAHAAETSLIEEPEKERHATLGRLLDHYSRVASAAMDRLYPYEADTRPARDDVPALTTGEAATWLDTELSNLLALARTATEHGYTRHLQHLSATLHRCLRTRGRYAEAESLHLQALAAARDAGDRTEEMEALLGLVEIRRIQGRYDVAIEDGRHVLDIARSIGHLPGELRALNSLGTTHIGREERVLAAGYIAQALEVAKVAGSRTGELDALIISGNIRRAMGEQRQGIEHLERALSIARSIGHRTGELRALIGLGYIHLRLEEYAPATGYFTLALSLARRTEHRVGELSSLNALGHLHRGQGRHLQAQDCYRRVAELASEIGNRNWQFEAAHGMGRLQQERGHYDQAIDSHRTALDLAAALDQPSDQARAHDGLAHAHAALGSHARARDHWVRALAILTTMGIDRMDERGVDVASIRGHLARRR